MMSSPIVGADSEYRRGFKRPSDSDHFSSTQTPSSTRKIDIECSPPKKVRFSDHFPTITERSDPLTECNLKRHTNRTMYYDEDKPSQKSHNQVSQSQPARSNCVMEAWLDDRYDFEWIWASKGGSGSTEDSCFDAMGTNEADRFGSCR